ncbi:MAG: lysophospholipid acyltransferase family protein [Candidatus Hydrogenedentes bacterium]|nr:lysophospholipid acyltransferase family protein [Candidatus Hydrogenedentota bacterium]
MNLGALKQWCYYFPLRWLAGWAPLSFIAWLARVAARLEYLTVRPATRRLVRDNLAFVLKLPSDSPRVRAIAHEVIWHYVLNIVEYACAHRLRQRVGESFLEVVGFEHAENPLKEGKGVVLVGGHLATFELHPTAFGWRGCNTALIEPYDTRPENAPRGVAGVIYRFRRGHQEQHLGYKTVYTGGGFHQAVKFLQKGGVVGIATDFPPPAPETTCPFLGAERPIPLGPAYLALKTGAAMVIGQLERFEFGQNRLTLSPVECSGTGDLRADVARLSRELALAYEQYILQRPEQWAWHMWAQTKPSGQ